LKTKQKEPVLWGFSSGQSVKKMFSEHF